MKKFDLKLSHIIIKVDDLDEAVKEWTNKGYVVEYGKSKNPYNALVYFKEGPYIELFKRCGLPEFMKTLMRLAGKKGFFSMKSHRLDKKIETCILTVFFRII